MSYKRKYTKGDVVTSLDELAEQKFVYIHDKIYHFGWWQSLQFGFLKRKLEAGCILKAERKVENDQRKDG